MFKKIAAATLIIIASSPAIAQQAPGFYVGADAASTRIDEADRDEGAGLFAGYKFNQTFAVEAGWHRLADTKLDNIGIRARFEQTDVSVLGTVPLSSGFSVYGRLGYNHIKAKATAYYRGYTLVGTGSEDKVLYGAGLSYTFSPAISGRLEVQKPSSDITKLAAGVAYHF